jgi:DNA helicase IV
MTKMTYTFDINQLHILNTLIFDSSIEYTELNSELKNDYVEYPIERRTFENVTREKNLLGTKTKYNGKRSFIKFSGIKSLSISKENNIFKDNHFIQNIELNSKKNVVELFTTFGVVIEFHISDLFCAELIDLKDSEFGKGTSSGKHGFTKEEWNEYLKKEKYVPQQRV